MSDARGPRARVIVSWITWMSALAIVTAVLRQLRTHLEQAHVVLMFLLIVLGGTAYGGRILGIALAISASFLIDYYFQSPYDLMSVGSSLDWFVLVAFLVTVGVTMHLLTRAQRAAAKARQHATEVARLSRFGSELLGAGRAPEALEAIVDAVRETLGAETCAVFLVHGDGDLEAIVQRGSGTITDLALARDAARTGSDVGEQLGGVSHRQVSISDLATESDQSELDDPKPPANLQLRALWMPLRVRGRIVGVLGAVSRIVLDLGGTHWRFANALRYYAALAVERVRLVAESEHAEALRETDRLRNALLASVSHDLRTPLTTIKVLAQESARQGDLALALSNARIIEEHADRLARVVGNVLDVTRLRARTLAVRLEFNTAEDLVGAVARQCAGVLREHVLERHIHESAGLLAGCFDFVQSLRILTNLVENAVHYSPPRAAVVLSAYADADRLVFEVADEGPGVPPAERERIFEPFYRAPDAVPDLGGTGLGLYIARALAEEQGGTLTYRARSPHGSVFTLRLPVMEAPPEDAGESLAADGDLR